MPISSGVNEDDSIITPNPTFALDCKPTSICEHEKNYTAKPTLK